MVKSCALSFCWIAGVALLPPMAKEAGAAEATGSDAEKNIVSVGQPDLAELQLELASKVRDARSMLSRRGKLILQDNQIAFAKYMAVICSPDHVSDEYVCRLNSLRSQLKAVSSAAKPAGPFLFIQVQIFDVIQKYDTLPIETSNEQAGLSMATINYPQIDAPITTEAKAWNESVAKKYGSIQSSCGAGSDDAQTYEIMGASAKIISVIFHYWEYCQGTPHGVFGAQSSNLLLASPPQTIELIKIFRPETHWRQFLTDSAVQHLRKHGGPNGPYRETEIAEIAPAWDSTFSMSTDNLYIHHQAGPYSLGDQDIGTPWSALESFLRSDAPIIR